MYIFVLFLCLFNGSNLIKMKHYIFLYVSVNVCTYELCCIYLCVHLRCVIYLINQDNLTGRFTESALFHKAKLSAFKHL